MISRSMVQNGPGFPYFAPAVYSYIATENLEETVTKVSVVDIADADLAEFVAKLIFYLHVFLIFTINI